MVVDAGRGSDGDEKRLLDGGGADVVDVDSAEQVYGS